VSVETLLLQDAAIALRSRTCRACHLALTAGYRLWLIVNVVSVTQVLQRMGYGDSTVRKSLLGQGRVLLFNYWLTYCVLKAKKPRFQPLLSPSAARSATEADSEEVAPAAVQPGRNGGGNGSTPKKHADGGR